MYQLGQARLDIALSLELSTKDKAAYMINTFEHVNNALRFKYNTNMS